MKLSEVLRAANTNLFLAVLGYFWSVFLHQFSLDQEEETHESGIARR